jgi:hypothetical protein
MKKKNKNKISYDAQRGSHELSKFDEVNNDQTD